MPLPVSGTEKKQQWGVDFLFFRVLLATPIEPRVLAWLGLAVVVVVVAVLTSARRLHPAPQLYNPT